jgi:hypothetical protein
LVAGFLGRVGSPFRGGRAQLRGDLFLPAQVNRAVD